MTITDSNKFAMSSQRSDLSDGVRAGFIEFCDDDLDLAEKLAECCVVRAFKQGEVLVSQGDEAHGVYILLSGEANVVLYSRGGHELWLDDLHKGALFGELAAVLQQPRTASVIALTAGQMACLGVGQFQSLLETESRFAMLTIRMQARRIHMTSNRMIESCALSVAARVYAELLRIGVPSHTDEEVFHIAPAPSVSAFAKRVNASRESVSRSINDYEKSGLLQRDGKKWTILAPQFE